MVLRWEVTENFPLEKIGQGEIVNWNDYRISSSELYTLGIESCLAIGLYDPSTKKGALAHISDSKKFSSRGVKIELYPEFVVGTLVSKLAKPDFLEAVLVGESRREEKLSNLIKRDLAKFKIPVVSEVLGHSDKKPVCRNVYFNCQAGEFIIYILPSTFRYF